jgi:hypothetical protein
MGDKAIVAVMILAIMALVGVVGLGALSLSEDVTAQATVPVIDLSVEPQVISVSQEEPQDNEGKQSEQNDKVTLDYDLIASMIAGIDSDFDDMEDDIEDIADDMEDGDNVEDDLHDLEQDLQEMEHFVSVLMNQLKDDYDEQGYYLYVRLERYDNQIEELINEINNIDYTYEEVSTIDIAAIPELTAEETYFHYFTITNTFDDTTTFIVDVTDVSSLLEVLVGVDGVGYAPGVDTIELAPGEEQEVTLEMYADAGAVEESFTLVIYADGAEIYSNTFTVDVV